MQPMNKSRAKVDKGPVDPSQEVMCTGTKADKEK